MNFVSMSFGLLILSKAEALDSMSFGLQEFCPKLMLWIPCPKHDTVGGLISLPRKLRFWVFYYFPA